MSFEFQNMLFDTKRQMLAAIAESWILGQDAVTADTVRQTFGEASTFDITAECIDEWELDQSPFDYEDSMSHMAAHGYTFKDLQAALQELRDNPERVEQ